MPDDDRIREIEAERLAGAAPADQDSTPSESTAPSTESPTPSDAPSPEEVGHTVDAQVDQGA